MKNLKVVFIVFIIMNLSSCALIMNKNQPFLPDNFKIVDAYAILHKKTTVPEKILFGLLAAERSRDSMKCCFAVVNNTNKTIKAIEYKAIFSNPFKEKVYENTIMATKEILNGVYTNIYFNIYDDLTKTDTNTPFHKIREMKKNKSLTINIEVVKILFEDNIIIEY